MGSQAGARRGRPRKVDRRPNFSAEEIGPPVDRVPLHVNEDSLGYPVAAGGQTVQFIRCDRRERRDGEVELLYLCAVVRLGRPKVEVVLTRQRNGIWVRLLR